MCIRIIDNSCECLLTFSTNLALRDAIGELHVGFAAWQFARNLETGGLRPEPTQDGLNAIPNQITFAGGPRRSSSRKP